MIHASPDAPAVDVWVNGAVAIEDLAFGSATDWIAMEPGSYDIAVTAADAAIDTAVISATLDLEAGTNYNVAAVGLLADITATVFTTDTMDLGADMARVQVIHASPDAPAVDIAVTGGDVLVPGLEFPNASGALDVSAGPYDLEVRVAGTKDVALPLPGVELEAGTVYDILAIGTLADSTLNVLVLTTMAASSEASPVASPVATEANVRVIHASPDAPAVDVWVNGAVAIEDLAFGSATDWIAMEPGSYDIAVTAADAAIDTAVISATLDLEAGTNYNVAAVGLLADITATVFTTDTMDLGADMARVQVIHASPDAPAVDIAVTGGDVLVPGLEFPNASGALDVPAGPYDLEVRVAGTEDVALPLPGVELEAGTVYDILAIGTLADSTLNVLVLTTHTEVD